MPGFISLYISPLVSFPAPNGAPQNFTNTLAESKSIGIVWETVPCPHQRGPITGYRLRYSNGTSIVNTSGEESRHHVLTGLTPYTNYSVQVAAVNDGGTGPYSNPLTVETLQDGESRKQLTSFSNLDVCLYTVPGLVTNLSVTPEVVQVTIFWNPPSDPNGVINEYGVHATSNASNGISSFTSATQHTISDLPPSTNITFSVRAYTMIGPGPNVTGQVSTDRVRK